MAAPQKLSAPRARTVLVTIALALAPVPAPAQCPDASATCICGPFPADGVLEGTLVSAIPPLAEFVVEGVHGDAGGYAVGDRVPLPWRGAEAEDLRMLLNLHAGEVVFRQRVSDDGRAVCAGIGFDTPVEDAVEAVLSEDCPQAVRDLGLAPGTCVGGGSSPSDSGGCAAAGGASQVPSLLAMLLGLAGWMLRTRFSADAETA